MLVNIYKNYTIFFIGRCVAVAQQMTQKATVMGSVATQRNELLLFLRSGIKTTSVDQRTMSRKLGEARTGNGVSCHKFPLPTPLNARYCEKLNQTKQINT